MLRSYLEAYISHNRAPVAALASLSFVASVLLGLIMGVGSLMVTDYLVRMAALGQAPDVTGSTIAFGLVIALAAVAVVLMLKSAFDVSMSARIRQLGLLKSMGAKDGQVRRLLLAEGCALSLPAAAAGVLVGLGLALALVSAVVSATAQSRTYDPVVEIAPQTVVLELAVAVSTVLVSALLPARRIGRVSIVQAMRQGDDDCRAAKRPGVLARIMGSGLGIEFQLAASSLRARRRGMRTANVSIALAVLAFVTLLNFETLSHLSTQVTYFDRYAGVWDVRVTVDGAEAAGPDQALVDELLATDGVTGVSTGDAYKVGSGDLFYNVLTDSAASEARVADELARRFAGRDDIEVLSLRAEVERDASVRAGLRLFVDVLAGVLACVGIADVFASVLGRIPARRREVSQLLAAGIARRQVSRMFTAESVLIVARPLAWTLVLNVVISILAVAASPVEPAAFLANMPAVPVVAFVLACWLLVRLAYALGERAVFRVPALAVDVE